MIILTGKYTTAKVMIDNVEEEAIAQITKFLNMPPFTNPVAIMSDVHAGKGSVVGFTMPLTDKVVPNVVGVDIGCGLLSVCIGKTMPFSLELLDHRIRQRIPFGMNTHDRAVIDMKKDFPWHQVNVLAQKFTVAYREKYGEINPPTYDMNWFEGKCDSIGGSLGRHIQSIATIGGGNHFYEVGICQEGNYWMTVHTGSRNFGLRICEYWQNKAAKFCHNDRKSIIQDKIKELKATLTGEELFHAIKSLKAEAKPTVDLTDCEWLEGPDAAGYLFDMIFAQVYAETNRKVITDLILNSLDLKPVRTIQTVHNFIDFRDFIIRKGAIRSYIGEEMVIPFNMRDGMLICEGRSNPEWNYSAPHGCGRIMSRSKAKKTLSMEEFKNQMEGIYSNSVVESTLDEAPGAYKDPQIIEAAIEPTAKILNRVKPVLNMKDTGK